MSMQEGITGGLIKVTDNVWVGDSYQEYRAYLWQVANEEVQLAVLNVAQDLQCSRGWNSGIEYAQVGLIDGPGNPQAMYASAVIALECLASRTHVLVCCHSGGRALAVAVMSARLRARCGKWDEILQLISERSGCEMADLPVIHEAHRKAFDRMDWGLLQALCAN